MKGQGSRSAPCPSLRHEPPRLTELAIFPSQSLNFFLHFHVVRLRQLLTISWRQHVGARARVQLAIQDTLDEGLPRAYSKELYETKCAAVFEHVYESYQGEGQSVYSVGA